TVRDIKRKNLPELDDEFAKDVSEFETLEEFKEDLKKRLKEQKERERDLKLEADVIEKAAANAEVDIPPVMIETEIDRMVRDFENRLRMSGMNLELYYRFSGQDEAALREQMREEAAKRVKSSLVLEAIAKAENVQVDEEDVNRELERMTQTYRQSVEKLRACIERNGNMDDFKADLRIKKTVKWLVENGKRTPEVA